MKSPYGSIYLITNTINRKVYVGQTVQPLNQRWNQHCYKALTGLKNMVLSHAIRKYGRDAFVVTLLHGASSQEELDGIECMEVHHYDSTNRTQGYNISPGGRTHRMSESTKRKIGAANSIALRGKKASPESIRKRSESLKARYAVHPRTPHSAETRRKISEAGIGRPAWNKNRERQTTDGTPEQIALRKRIIELRQSGLSFPKIAKMLGLKEGNTSAIYKRWVHVYADTNPTG
jgi:group I intron endonuclease